jgi:hypothetical protein
MCRATGVLLVAQIEVRAVFAHGGFPPGELRPVGRSLPVECGVDAVDAFQQRGQHIVGLFDDELFYLLVGLEFI